MKQISEGELISTALLLLAAQCHLADKYISSGPQGNSSKPFAVLPLPPSPALAYFHLRQNVISRSYLYQLTFTIISVRVISVFCIHIIRRVYNLPWISWLDVISSYIQEGICLEKDFLPSLKLWKFPLFLSGNHCRAEKSQDVKRAVGRGPRIPPFSSVLPCCPLL